MFWWRVGEFFKTVFTAIGKALAFPFVMLWRFFGVVFYGRAFCAAHSRSGDGLVCARLADGIFAILEVGRRPPLGILPL